MNIELYNRDTLWLEETFQGPHAGPHVRTAILEDLKFYLKDYIDFEITVKAYVNSSKHGILIECHDNILKQKIKDTLRDNHIKLIE